MTNWIIYYNDLFAGYLLCIIFFILSIAFSLLGCGSMFDITGKGILDRSIYYDVKRNAIINNKINSIRTLYFWKFRSDLTYCNDRVQLNYLADTLEFPYLKDSLSFYNYEFSIHLENDHWRMMYHLTVTKKLIAKKEKIYSRFTSH